MTLSKTEPLETESKAETVASRSKSKPNFLASRLGPNVCARDQDLERDQNFVVDANLLSRLTSLGLGLAVVSVSSLELNCAVSAWCRTSPCSPHPSSSCQRLTITSTRCYGEPPSQHRSSCSSLGRILRPVLYAAVRRTSSMSKNK